MEEFTSVNDRILKMVSPLRRSQRVELLLDLFNQLKKDRNWGDDVKINTAILHDIVFSYFVDVERHKDFHDIQKIRKYKISARLTEWIVKLRPIYFDIKDPEEVTSPEFMLLNEIFALKIGLAASEIMVEKIDKELTAKSIYTFHYRKITQETLSLWYRSLGGSADQVSG